MSRAIMLSEYGGEPVTLEAHDILFEIINTRITSEKINKKQELTSCITIAVNPRLAAHLAQHGRIAGIRLFKFHKYMLCRYADAQLRVKGKGHARPAIQEFLNLYGVEEDEYSLESAYKLFQRFGWNFDKKNANFSGHFRRNPGVKLSRKKKERARLCQPIKPLTIAIKDINVELAIGRFIAAYSRCFRRTPRILLKHARVYTYINMQALSVREAAEKLGMSRTGVQNSMSSFRSRMRRNPTVARMIEESIALSAATV